MAIKLVGIVGAGTMGNGIAQACAVAGIDALMLDVNPAALEKGVATISGSLDRLVKKEKITAEVKATAMAHVKTTSTLADLAACDYVIEAATENEALKVKILKDLDAALRFRWLPRSRSRTLQGQRALRWFSRAPSQRP